jgi:hypothetical protein
MMLEGYPAQNWCLEVEWESEAKQAIKGFAKVNELFSFVGGSDTTIEEIWLLFYPQNDVKIIAVPELPAQLPIIEETRAHTKYIAIFVRDLDLTLDQYVNDAERPLLVGYLSLIKFSELLTVVN